MNIRLTQEIFQMKQKKALKKYGITLEQYHYILNSAEIRRNLSDNNIHEVEIPDEINSQIRPSASNTSIATTPIAQPVTPQYQQQGSPIPRSTNQQMPQFTSPQSPLVALAHDYLAMSEYCVHEAMRIHQENPKNIQAIQYYDRWARAYNDLATQLMNQAAQPQWNTTGMSISGNGLAQTNVNAVNSPFANTAMNLANIRSGLEIVKDAIALGKEFKDIISWFGRDDEDE